MTEKHHRAADLMIDGRTYQQIADDLGMSASGVRTWTRDPEFQAMRQARAAEIAEAVKTNAVAARRAALAFLTDAVQDEGIETTARLKIAETILDRTGDAPNSGTGADAAMASILAKLNQAGK